MALYCGLGPRVFLLMIMELGMHSGFTANGMHVHHQWSLALSLDIADLGQRFDNHVGSSIACPTRLFRMCNSCSAWLKYGRSSTMYTCLEEFIALLPSFVKRTRSERLP
jgi:hypothetical protein